MRVPARRGETFFLGYSFGLLTVVLSGFASSFYLRSDDRPALELPLLVHGGCLTLWFLLSVFQAGWIGLARTPERLRLHRRVGWAGCLVAAGVAGSGVFVALRYYGAGNSDLLKPHEVLFINLADVANFCVCFVSGLVLRRRPRAHKRLMALAGTVILGPAAFRLTIALDVSPFWSAVIQLGFVAVLMVYDRRREGRVQRPTWLGAGLLLVMMSAWIPMGKWEAWTRLAERLATMASAS